MKKLLLFFLFACTLSVVSCKDDDDNPINIDFPLTVKPTNSLVKGDMQFYQKENGTLVSISADDTELDDDDAFTDIDSEPSFEEITFINETEATFLSDGDTTTGTYSISGDEIAFSISDTFGTITFTIEFLGKGDPELFDVESQVYAIGDEASGASFSLSVAGPGRASLEEISEEMEEGDKVVIMDYTEEYAQ